MAQGRRREERQRVIEQAAWVGALFSDLATPYAVAQFLKTGQLPDGSERQLPYLAAVEEKVAEIERNAGRLIV
jgi:hypothetical protein